MSEETSLTQPALTACQRQWLEHLEAWQEHEQELSLKNYAVAHGLSVSGLYTAKAAFKRRGIWPDGGTKAVRRAKATLVPVRVTPPVSPAVVPMLRVHLPNGIVVEMAEHAQPARCRELVSVLLAATS